jgi:hypothetical protein
LMKEVFMYFLVAITSWKYKGYASDDWFLFDGFGQRYPLILL